MKTQAKELKILLLFGMAALISILWSVPANAASEGSVSLNPGKSYTSYDITGDNKADTIKFSMAYNSEYDYYEGFKVIINNAAAYSCKGFFYDLEVKLYTLKNGKNFLYLYAEENNGDGPVCGLFQYKNGKLHKVIDFISFMSKYGFHLNGNIVSVKGNTIRARFNCMSYTLAGSAYYYDYSYKNGTLKRTSTKTSKIEYYTYDDNYNSTKCGSLILRMPLKVYTGTSCDKLLCSLKKGDKVKITGAYVKGGKACLKVKRLSDGKTGWLKCLKKEPSDYYPPFEQMQYAG